MRMVEGAPPTLRRFAVRERGSRFRMAHLRVTPQRVAVLEALEAADHPTAEVLVGALRGRVSPATVYNTLATLRARGMVAVIDGPGGRRYDPNLRPHPHLRCEGCGQVSDLPGGGAEAWAGIQVPPGWRPTGLSLVILGICPACAAEAR